MRSHLLKTSNPYCDLVTHTMFWSDPLDPGHTFCYLLPSTMTPRTPPCWAWEVVVQAQTCWPVEASRAITAGVILPPCHSPAPTYSLSGLLGSCVLVF